MIAQGPEAQRAITDLRRIVQKLAMVSHVSGASLGRSAASSDEERGGKRPPGGFDVGPRRPGKNASDKEWVLYHEERESFRSSYHSRTPEYFSRRLDGMARSPRTFDVAAIKGLVAEAEATLVAWRRQPIPKGQEPEYGSPQWKRYIAEAPDAEVGNLATRFNVTRRYINKIRKGYRDAA